MYNLYISEVFCSFLLTSGLPDVSDEDTQRSLDGDLAYSVHIRSPHIAEGKRSSHVVTIGEGESPSSPQTSSTPKIRQENTVPTTTQQTSVPQKKDTTGTMDHFSCYKDCNSRGSSQEIITRRGGGLASGLHTF